MRRDGGRKGKEGSRRSGNGMADVIEEGLENVEYSGDRGDGGRG